jgi:hypothetical protein
MKNYLFSIAAISIVIAMSGLVIVPSYALLEATVGTTIRSDLNCSRRISKV